MMELEEQIPKCQESAPFELWFESDTRKTHNALPDDGARGADFEMLKIGSIRSLIRTNTHERLTTKCELLAAVIGKAS